MESEPRQNPLSKDETIEQLQTTIGKLETIIEQLNSTSEINSSTTNSVETLITTTEELESEISNLSEEIVDNALETTINNEEVVENQSEVGTPLSSQGQVVTSESEILAEKTPTPETKDSETDTSQLSVTTNVEPSVAKVPTQNNRIEKEPTPKSVNSPKGTKPKKKKNWFAIAILTLIIAIIPVSLKYLAPELTPQILSDKLREIIPQNTAVITNKEPDNQFEVFQENQVVPEINNQLADIDIIQDSQPIIEDISNTKNPEKSVEETLEEIPELAVIDSAIEESNDLEIEQLSLEDQNQTQSIDFLKSEVEVSKIDNYPGEIIISDDLNIEQSTSSAESQSLAIDEIVEQEVDISEDTEELLVANNIPENIVNSEPKIIIPENLVAETTEQALDLKTLIHNVKLTPEQNLIALLSDKVLQLTQDYQDNIITSIEPNLTNNVLTVKIADDWYQLATTEQDKIVADMFTRSQELEFGKLEIKDQNNNLVARSPVVGQNMIILRRDS